MVFVNPFFKSFEANRPPSSKHSDFMIKEIAGLIEAQQLEWVSPLLVAEDTTKLRLISNLSYLNEFLVKTNFRL